MVETITLEDAFRRWGTPQLCKIDIEGSEIEVISSASGFLRSQMPLCQFAIDTNHLVDGSFTDTRIEDLFHKIGYEAETAIQGFKTTWARLAE